MLLSGISERRKMGASPRSLGLRRYWPNCSRRQKRSRNRVRQSGDNTRPKSRHNSRLWKRKEKLTRTAVRSLHTTRGSQKWCLCLSRTLRTTMSSSKRKRRRRKVQLRNRRRRRRISQVCACSCTHSHVDTKLGDVVMSYHSYAPCAFLRTKHWISDFTLTAVVELWPVL